MTQEIDIAALRNAAQEADLGRDWGAMPMRYDMDHVGGDDDWIVYESGSGCVARSVEKGAAEYIAAANPAAILALLDRLEQAESGLAAYRIALASEFPPDADGDPDVGNVHANVRALKARLEQAEKDAARYRWLRENCALQSHFMSQTEGVYAWIVMRRQNGRIASFNGPELDAAIDAAMQGEGT